MNLAANLEASAFFFPDNPAVRQGTLVTTYAQLNERANRIATGLMKMGSGSFKALDSDRNDTAAILYTGGTTGTPKGVMLTHEGIQASSHSVAHCERSTESDVALCFLPFNHVFGQMHIMNATILSSGCLELLPSFDMDLVLEAMQSDRLTKFFAVPTVYMRLLTLEDLENKLGRLRYCFSAAASMPVEIVRQWKERTGISISEGYGMTEAMPVSYNHYHRHVIGSVGQPVDGVEVQIRDAWGKPVEPGHRGEVCVRGRIVMKGYLNDPEGTRSAFWDGGWYRSGDVGQFDSDGYLYIVDRLKDMIITGGELHDRGNAEKSCRKDPETGTEEKTCRRSIAAP